MTSKKTGIMLVSLALILALTVSGTAALLIDATDPVTNTFTVPSGAVKLTGPGETKPDGTGTNAANEYTIRNDFDTAVYIRVTAVANAMQGGKVDASAQQPTVTISGTGWVKNGSYYYYESPVPVGTDVSVTAAANTGTLQLLIQAIQAEPAAAIQDAWNITPDSSGKIPAGS